MQSPLGKHDDHREVHRNRNILYTPKDRAFLSEQLCLLRAQIEAFAATPEDAAVRLKTTGKKICVGRVGIRCVHCTHVPPQRRVKGAVSYPQSIQIVHQAVRNFQRYHFMACPHIPPDVKEEFGGLQSKKQEHSKRDSSDYWIECCERMGMLNADADNGILFKAENSADRGIADDQGAPYQEHNSAPHTDESKMLAATSAEPSRNTMPAALSGANNTDADNMSTEMVQGLHKETTAIHDESGISSTHTDDSAGGFVHFVDIGPYDVLLGRGPTIHETAGNVAFRQLVATRKAEYLGAVNHKEKNRIAREVVNHVRCKDPPGRFLAMVGKSRAEAMGSPTSDADLWCAVEEKTALEKTKQTLRQQMKWGGREERKQPAGKRLEHPASAESRGSEERSVTRSVDDTTSSAAKPGGTTSANNDEGAAGEPGEGAAVHVRKNDTLLGTNYTMGFANAAMSSNGVVQTSHDVRPQAQIEHVQANVTMPFARLMSADLGAGVSSATQETRPILENGSDENAHDERSSVLKEIRLASEAVEKIQEINEARAAAYQSCIGVDGSHSLGDFIRRDLVSFGSDLYRRFAGSDPFVGSSDGTSGFEEARLAIKESSIAEVEQVQKKVRRSNSRRYVLLRDLGFTVSLCILVSSLLDAEDESAADRYKTAEEVEEDLGLMIANPERYLFDAGVDSQRGQLVFSEERLYGREDNIACMMEVFDRAIGSTIGPPEMLLISGYSGTGKSLLVGQLRRPLLQKNGHLVSGKFDQLGQVQPMSVIFDAFNQYCDSISKGSDDMLRQTQVAIQEALGSNAGMLIDSIPNLCKLIGAPTKEAVQVGGRKALNRFLFFFRRFVQALSRPSHPIILFLDDLQWADKASLEIISTIVSDSDITSLMFVGCYRENAVDDSHPLTEQISKLSLAGVNISNIKLENIDRTDVNALVSDALHLSPRITWPLADIIFNKTSGNPLFAVQFLCSLCDDKLLHYSAKSRRWEWDVEAIEAKDVADNVVDLMTRKILKLDSEVQWILKVAACLGSQCEPSMMDLIGSGIISEAFGAAFLLDVCVREGLMCKLGSVYKFSHDQIEQAAYSLIAASDREALHLHIGRCLWKMSSAEDIERLIFIVVDQLQRGCLLITDHDEKVEVARLCLTAGEKAMSSSAFPQAAIYLLQGSVLLQESDWDDHYNLFLRLLSSLAEVQYAIGDYDGLEVAVNSIIRHGRCLQDKLWAIRNQLRSKGGQGKPLEAINFGLNVLAELGESFPSEVDERTVKLEFVKTRELCDRPTKEEILKKESMTDPNIVGAMRILTILLRFAYQSDQHLCSLVIFRMVQLTMSHGTCKESTMAFATFGLIFSSSGDFEQGYHYGKLSLSLLDALKAKEHLAQVYTTVYGLINTISEPLQAIPPSLIRGYEVGMSTGDIEYGLTCAALSLIHTILCGSKLEPLLAERCWKVVRQMKDYKHHSVSPTLPWLQAVLNLTGDAEDPTMLTGEAMNQEELLESALEKLHMHVVSCVTLVRLWLCLLFRRHVDAAELVERQRQISKKEPLRLEFVVYQTFCAGLVAVERARSGGREMDWRSIACESLEKMRIWARSSAWNFQHKLDLLNAEMAYLNGDTDAAAKAYDDSIRVAGERGFVHEEALACERAGLFYLDVCEATAAEYFEKAHTCYLTWGAVRKARDLSDEHLLR